MKLTEIDLRVANATAKEKTRPALYNVLLRKGRLVSADGFILVTKKVRLDPGERLGEEKEVLLSPDMLRMLKPQEGEEAEVILTQEGKFNAYLKDRNGMLKEPILVFTRSREDVTYPEYESKLTYHDPKADVALDIKLLRKLLSALPEEGILRLNVGERTEPVEFSIHDWNTDSEVRGFQMPMFVQWEEHYWMKDVPTCEKVEGWDVKEES